MCNAILSSTHIYKNTHTYASLRIIKSKKLPVPDSQEQLLSSGICNGLTSKGSSCSAVHCAPVYPIDSGLSKWTLSLLVYVVWWIFERSYLSVTFGGVYHYIYCGLEDISSTLRIVFQLSL